MVDRRALVVTALCFVAWRLLYQIPVVFVSSPFIHARVELYAGPVSVASIGSRTLPLEAYSLGYVGISTYVLALVIVSVATAFSAWLRNRLVETEGRLRLERWIRALALLLAAATGYGWISLAQNAGALPQQIDWFERLTISLELAAGTGVMIMLASALDEYGLGFGYGAVIFYALDIFAGEGHRIADYLAYYPSLQALTKPLALWALFTVAIAVAGVAIYLARREIWFRAQDDEPTPVDLKLVLPGILRPGIFTFAVLGAPASIVNMAPGAPQALRWLGENWSPYGAVPWLDATYIVVEAAVFILFAVAVVKLDWFVTQIPWELEPHGTRLAVISGVLLALLIAVARPAAHYATHAAGVVITVSGFDILLLVGTVLAVILCIEGRRHPLVTTEAMLP